jgi:hypothetical protein
MPLIPMLIAIGLTALGTIAASAQSSTDALLAASALRSSAPTVVPQMTPEAFGIEALCQTAYEDDAIARCIAARTQPTESVQIASPGQR